MCVVIRAKAPRALWSDTRKCTPDDPSYSIFSTPPRCRCLMIPTGRRWHILEPDWHASQRLTSCVLLTYRKLESLDGLSVLVVHERGELLSFFVLFRHTLDTQEPLHQSQWHNSLKQDEMWTHVNGEILQRAVDESRWRENFGQVFEWHVSDSYRVRQRDHQETLWASERPALAGIQLWLHHKQTGLKTQSDELNAIVRVFLWACYLYNRARAFRLIPEGYAE